MPLGLLLAAVLGTAPPPPPAPDLRLTRVRHSLAGTHRHYQQSIGGIDVAGAERVVTIRADGTQQITDVLSGAPAAPPARSLSGAGAPLSYLNIDGLARPVFRAIENLHAVYTDAETGAVLRREPLFFTASARVFSVNPVAALNDPSLQDRNDARAAVPEAAYRVVELPGLPSAGPLAGPHVAIVDREQPATVPAEASQSLHFDRSQAQFEEVNAYYAIDRNQRYLQSLGYDGVRRVVDYAIPVDPHAANGADTSFYLQTSNAGRGVLLFGDGGTDDAEDSDLMLHEYAHAIHDWIVPGALGGTPAMESRAIGEGFADYWAFSAAYAETVASGRDPSCIADWDTRCWEDDGSQQCGYPRGTDCLRRVDGTKTMADFVASETAGTEHRNGEIWSSALREIFLAFVDRHGLEQGKRISDTIAIESLFGLPPNPTFRAVAARMLDADRLLFGGAHAAAICAAMTKRRILDGAACDVLPRGESIYFQSVDHGVPIPDAAPAGIVSSLRIDDARAIENLYVRVDIAHPSRGDLRVSLVAPDGTEVLLHQPSLDRTRDLRATFGLDTQPVQPLSVLRGRSAAGEWRLRVADTLATDVGTLVTWSLVIQFAGDAPAAARPSTASRMYIAAAAHATGANGALFTTGVRIYNRGTRPANVTLIFTPGGADGTARFAAFRTIVAPRQIAAFDDIVARQFLTAGLGAIELSGDVADLVVTSHTSTPAGEGSHGQFIGAVRDTDAAGIGAPRFLPYLDETPEFRSNVGFAETAGSAGTIRVRWFDGTSGAKVEEQTFAIPPFGHLQSRAPVRGAAMSAEVVVIEGSARVVAYASVVDNRSGDAVYVPATMAPDVTRSEFVPAIVAPGALGTFWRSELRLTSVSDIEIAGVAAMTFVDAASGRTSTKSVSLPGPRQVTAIAFDEPPSALGLLRIHLPAHVVATSRIATAGASGSYGQFVPFRRAAGGRDVIHLENSPRFRTNVGVMNVGSAPVEVTLVAWDGAGNEIGSHVVRLGVSGSAQVPLSSFAGGNAINGRVSMIAPEGVLLYASVVDNVTGDPMFIPAQ